MILITGANGQLGQVFRTILSTEDAIFKGRELDITDIEALREFTSKNNIKTIINTAAYTAVDLAETESALAFHINSLGARNLALISKEFQIKLIHISTDYVFDGTNYKPYNEQDITNPMSVYGQSKLEGEKAVLELSYSAYIIRTSWLYSGFGKNFLTNITRLAQERDSLSIVADQIGTPTYAPDLARAILELIPNLQPHNKQILHYSNQGVASWYDFAYEIINLQNINCKLTPIPTTAYPTPATRPYYSVLDKTLVSNLLQSPIPHWKASLLRHLSSQ
ncbi:MAG: hypothetical protein RLZZ223_300 [Candidatus Parcubacteria bacterium]